MKLSFRERAKLLGHSLELLDDGVPVSSTMVMETVDQLKSTINMYDNNKNPQLAQMLFGNIPIPPDSDISIAGTLRRVNQFVYAGDPLADSDRQRIAAAFPMTVQFTSVASVTPTTPWIITTPGTVSSWNIGTLTLNDGIYITAYQTVLMLSVDNIVRNGTSGINPNIGDINIFGATGSTGTPGVVGNVGTVGSAGTGSSCSVSGSEPGADGGPGGTGVSGGTGGPGGNGGLGIPSYQATININETIQGANPYITVYTRSGTGGSGGIGGAGGTGGAGGNGADGANCECTGTNGGNAGNGGVGGVGGQGGDAGDAVKAAGNIVVQVAQAYINNVLSNMQTAAPGGYGTGGAPGLGGQPGSAGNSGKHSNGGAAGAAGATGSWGNNGSPSFNGGTAAVITINPM